MEKQEIRTFGRRHGKKLSTRQAYLIDNVLPTILPGACADILEIGFGAGEHVRQLAGAHPDKIIVGAEPFINGVASLMSAISDATTHEILPEYKNIRIFPDDVRKMLNDADSKFDEIWVLHPDPWPKARHEKRRLLNAEFLTVLAGHLTPGGKIIIGTDHWEYFDWIVDQVAKTKLHPVDYDMDIIHTRYQQKNKANADAPKYLVLGNKND